MAQYNDVISQIDGASASFDSVVTKTEKKIFDSAVALIQKLDVDKTTGQIKQTTANLKLLSDIKARLAQIATKDKAYLQGVKDLAKMFDVIYKQQAAFYSTNFAQKTLNDKAKAKYEAMKRVAVETTIDGLTGAGLQSNVLDPLSKTLLRAVTSGAKYSDLIDELRKQLTSLDADNQSDLAKYAKTYATTALTQYAGQNNRLFTDDLGAVWFRYVGSEIETTREFCHHLTAKEYIHISEFPDILKGRIEYDGEVHQCKMNPKTGLPYGLIDGTTPDNFQVNVGGWNCRHQLVPIAKEAVPKDIRAKFDTQTQAEIAAQKEAEEKAQKIAELKAALAQFEQWKDADTSGIQSAIAAGDIPALQQQIVKMQDIEKQLAKLDLLANPKQAMQEFTVSELQAVQDAVAAKLASFEAKGITGEHLVKKLQFEAQWVQDNKKYPTWQVAQQAYNKKLAEVQKDIALKALQPDVMQMMSVKTKSPQFKAMLQELTQAYSDGDIPKVQQLISDMQAKAAAMQKRQQQYAAKHTQTDWDAETYSQKRKNAAMWAHDTRTADDNLRDTCGDVWRNASNAEKDAIFGYTQSYHNIQEPLRGIQYIGSQTQTQLGLKRIPHITDLIAKSKYNFDMWVQRGDDLVALKKFGLPNYATATDAVITALVGRTGTEGAFWSAGVAKGKGFSSKQVIFNIYCPRGTRMMYCEPFSDFGCGAGRHWDGTAKQTNFGSESEILLQRGTTFRVTKVEKAGGRWYVDVEVISQNPLPFPYANGYPYQY